MLCSDFPVPTGRMLFDLGRMAKPCLSGFCNLVRSLSHEQTPSSELLGVLVAAHTLEDSNSYMGLGGQFLGLHEPCGLE